MIDAINWKDLLARAGWTFLQVFLASFIVAGESILDLLFRGDWSNLWVLLVATILASVSAGLSAVKTILVEVVRSLKK